jgi:hypothetical protein
MHNEVFQSELCMCYKGIVPIVSKGEKEKEKRYSYFSLRDLSSLG